MGCTITSDKVEILMNNNGLSKNRPITGYRSALQNPDLHRAQLAALLRRGEGGRKRRNSLWSSFTNRHLGRHANCND